MRSRTTNRFRRAFNNLPLEIQGRAERAYELFEQDPGHPSLRFKKVHAVESIYSVRITRDYRALGLRKENDIFWFWIGSHDDYERLLQSGL